MKTLKSIMVGLVLLTICGIVKASPALVTGPTKDEVINTYLNALVHGKLARIDDAIDNDAEFNMWRGGNVNTLNKQQMLVSIKANENTEQDCKCTNTSVQDGDEMIVRKVEMHYADFTRTDVITAQRGGGGWKITKVDTSFK